MAKAACALEAVSRWAVTGTPIQNRLSDLAALLCFIRAHPYTDPKTFDADISHLWKSGDVEEASKRLKSLSAYLILRRPKKTVELPRRVDKKYPIELHPDERQLYNTICSKALVEIDEAMQTGSEATRAAIYARTLQMINSLRLICDLGLHYRAREVGRSSSRAAARSQAIAPTSSAEPDSWDRSAQSVFGTRRDMGEIACLQCASVLDPTEDLLDDVSSHQNTALFSRCLKFLCSSCAKRQSQAGPGFPCGHQPPCPAVSVNPYVVEDLDGLAANPCIPETAGDVMRLPSKVEVLMADLKSLPPNTKW